MILIIGAGPAGLAIAHALQRRGLAYHVFERGRAGEAWHNHYDRLHLHTLKQVSALPGLAMPASYPKFPAAAQFRAYLADYARHFKLNISFGVDVRTAHALLAGWRLETSSGMFEGETLVLATGIWSTPVTPTFACREQFGGMVVHSRDYRNAALLQGKRVLVVGAGNSGSEIAVDLSENGIQTAIAIRSGVSFVPYPVSAPASRTAAWLFRHLPRPVGALLVRSIRRNFCAIGLPPPRGALLDTFPVVGFQLPEAIAAGRIALYAGIERFTADGVRFVGGQEAPFDAVIMATGFRASTQLVANQVALDNRGRPQVDKHWRSLRNPRLVCIGFDYPTTEGWLQAIGRVAGQAADGIAATALTSRTGFYASQTR